jgi:hypothetical protein
MNVHIGPKLQWNRSPFEMDTGFCAIGVANATGSRYHFMCVEMRSAVFFSEWAAVLAVVSESTCVLSFAVARKTAL